MKEELKIPIPLKIICFLLPFVGLIIYVCNVQKNRKYANKCGLTSLIGLLLPIFIIVIIKIVEASISSNYEKAEIETKSQQIHEENLKEAENILNNIEAQTITVPKVIYYTFEEAKQELEELNFKVEKIEQYSVTVEKGYVYGQTPQFYTTAWKGDTIKLYVSKGAYSEENN